MSFLFTSDHPSPHHDHLGYGLKRGLKGSSREVVAILEVACVALAREQRELEGRIVALGVSNQRLWSGHVSVIRDQERGGRIIYSVEGPCPAEEMLRETWSWAWLSHHVERELVTQEQLRDYVWRLATPETPLLDARERKQSRQKTRRRSVYLALFGLIIFIALLVNYDDVELTSYFNSPTIHRYTDRKSIPSIKNDRSVKQESREASVKQELIEVPREALRESSKPEHRTRAPKTMSDPDMSVSPLPYDDELDRRRNTFDIY